MVLEKPAVKKEISKLEILKVDSANLRHPLLEVGRCCCLSFLVVEVDIILFHITDTEVIEVILSPSDRYMQTNRKALSHEPVDFLGKL
jgi:hypothetical protein